jgi:hypothetical protein
MKRSLRGTQKSVNENELNKEQKDQLEKLKGVAKKYEGKSESEIYRDLSQAVEKGKKDGTITNEKMSNIASQIAPMLNGEQRKKLEKLMSSLKK